MALEEMRRLTGRKAVPQVFIGDDHIGGYGDFLVLDAKGEIDARFGRKRKPAPAKVEIQDLLIIGAGPAGMTAAVYAARKGLSTVIISDQLGGQPALTATIENYMGYQFITGPELMARFEAQTRRYPGVALAAGEEAIRLELDGRMKKAITESGKIFTGRAAIIASGKRSRTLNVPGEHDYIGRGVSYCATCDAPLYAGESVLVAGGGNSALEAALELAALCPRVHLVSLSEPTGDEILLGKVMAETRILKHLLWRLSEIKGDGKEVTAAGITSADGARREEVPVKAVFVEIGLHPNSAFAVDLVRLNRAGEIEVDSDCCTGVPGIFAAGDVTQVRDKQIIVAAGEGAKAALSAQEYLLSQR